MTARPFPVLRSARYAAGASSAEQIPWATLPEVAFAGRSNVGKSSLLNALVGRRGLARVSRTPGRTQLIHFFALNEALHLVDLPGYGYAAVSKASRAEWKYLVEAYLRERERLFAVVLLCDVRRDPGEEECAFVAWLHDAGIATIVVATKCDKVPKSGLHARLSSIRKVLGNKTPMPIATAATAGVGLEDVWRALAERLPTETREALQ